MYVCMYVCICIYIHVLLHSFCHQICSSKPWFSSEACPEANSAWEMVTDGIAYGCDLKHWDVGLACPRWDCLDAELPSSSLPSATCWLHKHGNKHNQDRLTRYSNIGIHRIYSIMIYDDIRIYNHYISLLDRMLYIPVASFVAFLLCICKSYHMSKTITNS